MTSCKRDSRLENDDEVPSLDPKFCMTRVVIPPTSYSAQAKAGRWTQEEHEAFLIGLKLHGREWKKVNAGG